MKIVFVINSLGGGGAERVTATLANQWAEKGWSATVVTLAPRSLDCYELHPSVSRIALNLLGDSSNIAIGLSLNLRRVMTLRAVIQKIDPDVVLAMMSSANVLLALASLGLDVLAVGAERVHPPQYPLTWIWEALRRRTYGFLDAVTALTAETGYWLAENTSAKRVAVIPNAASWPLAVQKPQLNVDSVCPPSRKILLAVGRLEPEKGFDGLLKVFASLAQRYSGWDLVILGDGSLRSKIEDDVSSAGLSTRVFLPGRAGNVGDWYARADLFAMTSRYEGFPNALVEALAQGLPAVSFDCDTGPRDIIRHEVDGLLVPPGDLTGFSDALERLMESGDLRERFSQRAVEARQRFSLERIIGMWEELFAAISNEKFRRDLGHL